VIDKGRNILSIRKIILQNRLGAIAGFIEKGSRVADVGTDHGLIPVYLAQNGIARRIIATDISDGALSAAIRSAAKYGVSDMITFIRTPGLAGISEREADTVVISGMGGETIAGILEDATWTKNPGVRLILQPQTKIGELCRRLNENGYALNDAKIAREKGKLYIVMLAGGGEAEPEIDAEMELYSRLISNNDPLIGEYIDSLATAARWAAEGMKAANAADYPQMAERLERLLKLFRRLI